MVLIGAVLWGVSGTAAQVLFQNDAFSPAWLVMIRMTLAGFLLLTGFFFRSGPVPVFRLWKSSRSVIKLILFSIVGLAGVQYSYFAAISYGNAATATMLQYMGPIFITGYVVLQHRRLPSILQGVAIVLALLGAFLLITDGNFHSLSVAPLSVFWGLISAITVAFYTLYPKPLLQEYGSAIIVGWGMLIGGIGMSFFTPLWHFTGHGSLEAWSLVGFVIIFGTLIAFYVYIASLNYISASEASLLSCGEPLSAAIIAVGLLHVQMGLPAILGGLCIVVTVTIMANKRYV